MKFLEKEKAVVLRKDGVSICDISKRLGVSKGTVSVWVRNVDMTKEQKEALNKIKMNNLSKGTYKNSEKYRLLRLEYQKEGREKAKNNDPDHKAMCMLYWAEGSKCKNSCRICNCDPNLLVLFLNFLRKFFAIEDKTVCLTVKIHRNHILPIKEIEGYWIKTLKVPSLCLRTGFIDNRVSVKESVRKNKIHYGVCEININKTSIVQHIFGAIQEYGNFTNEKWLG